MKKLVTVSLCLVILLSLLAASAKEATAAPTEPIKIGFVGGMSGVFADYTIPAQIGLEVAIEEVNAKGGILGRKIELIVRDSKAKPDVGMSEARQLITGKNIDILTGACSGAVTLAMADVAEQSKIVHLAFPTGTNVIAPRQNRYLFMMGVTADLMSYGLADYLSNFRFKKYYLLGADYVYGHQLIEYFWERLSALKPDVEKVGEAFPALGTADFVPFITAAMSAKPDAVISACVGTDDNTLIKQAQGFDYFDKIQHCVLVGLSTSGVIPFGKDYPMGVIGGSSYDIAYCEAKYEKSRTFNKMYNEKAGKYANFFGDSNEGYDAAQILFSAIEKAGSTDPEKLIPALENARVTASRGEVWMLPKTHRLIQPYYCGISTYYPPYEFAVLKESKEYKGMDFQISDETIMAGWK